MLYYTVFYIFQLNASEEIHIYLKLQKDTMNLIISYNFDQQNITQSNLLISWLSCPQRKCEVADN